MKKLLIFIFGLIFWVNMTSVVGAQTGLVIDEHEHNSGFFSVTPQYQELKPGEVVNVIFKEYSDVTDVNGVLLSAMYPQDEMQLVKFDAEKSVFPISKEEVGTNGIIEVSRESNSPVRGEQIVISAQFKAIKDTSTTKIFINNVNSAIWESQHRMNIVDGSVIQDEKSVKIEPQQLGASNFMQKIMDFFKNLFKK